MVNATVTLSAPQALRYCRYDVTVTLVVTWPPDTYAIDTALRHWLMPMPHSRQRRHSFLHNTLSPLATSYYSVITQ